MIYVGSHSEKFALLFPGLGSQMVGMGRYLYECFTSARRLFDTADEVLGSPLRQICFDGPQERLNIASVAQPAVLTVSVACLAALREYCKQKGVTLRPSTFAGHSLGQYSALVAAGVVDFVDALRLVRRRAHLMEEAGASRPGGMAAVMGLRSTDVNVLCESVNDYGVACVAALNSASQVVVSGDLPAIKRVLELALARGAAKVVPLPVTIAAHSPLMETAGKALETELTRVHFREPMAPVALNTSGKLATSADEIRREMMRHMCAPVNWSQCMSCIERMGVHVFLEVGPGQVLCRLVPENVTCATAVSLGFLQRLDELVVT